VWPSASNLNSLGLRKNEEVGLYQWFSDVASEPLGAAVGPPPGLCRVSRELGVGREVEAQETLCYSS